MTHHSLSITSAERIEAAAQRIDPVFAGSPQYRSEALSRRVECNIICKVETMNPIRSFKGRGVDWWAQNNPGTSSLSCLSSGNFGQAMAYVGGKHGREVNVFTIAGANPLKVAAMRELGARVHMSSPDYAHALTSARQFAETTGSHLVLDGDAPEITEGAGTIAVELAALPAFPDVILVPVGDGALINGIGSWCKARRAATRVIGVCAEGAPAMARSWQSGELVQTPGIDTIADGIGVAAPAAEAANMTAHTVDEMLLVSDQAMRDAMGLYYELEKLIVEPAGAASLAAALQIKAEFAGKTACLIISGANADPKLLPQWPG